MQRFFQKGQMIAIYTDTEEWFGAGYLLGMDDEIVMIRGLSTDGSDDGITLYRREELVKIETETQYLQRLQKLCLRNETPQSAQTVPCDLKGALKYASQQKWIVEVQLLASHQCDALGWVDAVDDAYCCICQLDRFGRKDGKAYFALDDISSIKLNSAEGRGIAYLCSDR